MTLKKLILRKLDDGQLDVEIWHIDTGAPKEIFRNCRDVDLYTNGSKTEISFVFINKDFPIGYRGSLNATIELINFRVLLKSAGISGSIWVSTVWEKKWKNMEDHGVTVSLTHIELFSIPDNVKEIIQL